MPWKCRLVASHEDAKNIGDMWMVDAKTDDHAKVHWLVIIPNGEIFDLQMKSADGTYWNVTGDAPNFTVTPSVNDKHPVIAEGNPWWAVKGWHGYITNGVISDDVEGRAYP